MFSQKDEERVIVEYLGKEPGRFCDIGAFDGQLFSNTLQLAKQGWTGLAIEADPYAICGLIETYRRHDITGVEILHAAITGERGIVKFHSACGDAISTVNEKHRDKWAAAGSQYRDIFTPCVTFADVLAQFGKRFDFVSLDVEGTNWPILQQIPLDTMGVRLVCVEYDGYRREMVEYCGKLGLTQELLRNNENLILGKP